MTFMYRYNNGTGEVITLDTHRVVKETPCGKWIDVWGTKRFVLNGSRKRYAHETKELALSSFVFRKRRQIGCLTAQLNACKHALAIAEEAGTPERMEQVLRERYYLMDFE